MFSDDMKVSERWEAMNGVEQETIKQIHAMLRCIKDNPDDYHNPVILIEDLEHALQGLWRFERNASYHTHWLDIAGCSCPKMDNLDPLYWGFRRVINRECKWHGGTQNNIK